MATEEPTEQPTPRKRRRAREKGQVPTSVDLSRAVALLLIYLAWRFAGPTMLSRLTGAVEDWLRVSEMPPITPESIMAGYAASLPLLLAVLGPVMLAAVIGTAVAAAAQTRGLLTTAAVQPDWSRINPANGLRRIFSVRGSIATIKGIVQVCVVMIIAIWVLRGRADEILAMGDMEIAPAMATVLAVAAEMLVKCMLTLLVVGAADYAFEWWDNEKALRMTRQELKRELREEEGDPHIQRRRREIQRGMLAQGISAEMPQADVVVTNPTHYAVALRYEAARMPAPRVVARGQRRVARRIIALARTWGIPVIHNPPVARSLFTNCRLGEMIPERLYQVVAEIFAAVYRRRRQQAGPGRAAGGSEEGTAGANGAIAIQ
ncbi:MAG: EscU/YscU/HrcU family type III secretion system export apparatus switch protein [Armatimonadota bacterium]